MVTETLYDEIDEGLPAKLNLLPAVSITVIGSGSRESVEPACAQE